MVNPLTVTSRTSRRTSPVAKLMSPRMQMPFTSAGVLGSKQAFCVGVTAGSSTAQRDPIRGDRDILPVQPGDNDRVSRPGGIHRGLDRLTRAHDHLLSGL